MLAGKIGEIDLAVEASKRYAATQPQTLGRLLHYYSELATRGRLKECRNELDRLPPQAQDNPAVLHLKATLATQLGDFAEAEPLIRRTIKDTPLTGQNWLSLAMIKKFLLGDPDIALMESFRIGIKQAPPASQAPFFYALGKAYHDVKDYDRAFAAYQEGAAQKRLEEKYDNHGQEAFARHLVDSFTADSLARFKPSYCASDRAIFVTGLPRSGTTLVEQILTSHSSVVDGAELNLFRAALIPAGDYSYQGALAYQHRRPDIADPWAEVAQDYLAMLDQRFGPYGRVVDKTLNSSRFMGLMLHAMPQAKVVWLRRNPEDAAISVFRNYFSAPSPWTWSLEDIGAYFRSDDMLHAHWTKLFPERILTVPYEGLVREPHPWIRTILAHVDLEEEDAVFEPHKQQERSVITASVAQVREPISTKQIGAAAAYDKYMQPFRDAYYQ